MVTYRCEKEDKFNAMEHDIGVLKKLVIEGNGESLVVMTQQTITGQKVMKDKLWAIDSNVNALMKFQNKVEAQRDMKRDIEEKKVKKRHLQITLMVAIIVGLGSAILIIIFT